MGAAFQSGPVAAWGDNQYGQTTIPVDLGPCTQIAAGGYHTVAIQLIVCPADFNHDGMVDGLDLVALLAAWGSTTMPALDLNQDGVINASDLAYVLAGWGVCAPN